VLTLYNTLSRKKEPFRPLDAANVRIYVCGPTVYDFAHIGNARPVIVFDVLYRLLRQLYGPEHVTYVRNITDVDDKINARAAEEYPNLPLNEAIRLVTEKTERQFHEDMRALGALDPNVQPRATEHIPQMKEIIETLVKRGCAYVAEGHVLFHVASMPDYGKLSGRSLDEMIAGARVEVAPFKKDPMDFVLWKPSKPGEPSWPSPAGIAAPGRPGWHIECSAMAAAHLGQTFDIHGGGIDLVFPHHENEIAQSRSAFGTPTMAQAWMHNGFLQVEGEKMAKSLGNFVTVHELLRTSRFGGRKWTGPVIRTAMLQSHYRQPLDWTVSLLEQSEARLHKWREFAASWTVRRESTGLVNDFESALCDDLNTPAAFAVIDEAVRGQRFETGDRYTVYQLLKRLGIKQYKAKFARVVASLEKAANSVGAIAESDWSFLARQIALNPRLRRAEAEVYAYLKAFRDLFENLRREPNIHSFELPVEFEKRLTVAPKDAKDPKTLVANLEKAADSLGKITEADWNYLARQIAYNPRFLSGLPKPETEIYAYLKAFRDLYENLKREPNISSFELPIELEKHVVAASGKAKETRILRLIQSRDAARKAKNFKEADRIRDELEAMGITLKDAKDPKTGELVTTWEVAR